LFFQLPNEGQIFSQKN